MRPGATIARYIIVSGISSARICLEMFRLMKNGQVGVTSDFPGMNWRRGTEGSATVSPSDWFDHIQGETAGHVPVPVAPGAAGAGTAVYHWPGDWRVGSLTIGKGSHVASVVWQKNRGFARHV